MTPEKRKRLCLKITSKPPAAVFGNKLAIVL